MPKKVIRDYYTEGYLSIWVDVSDIVEMHNKDALGQPIIYIRSGALDFKNIEQFVLGNEKKYGFANDQLVCVE